MLRDFRLALLIGFLAALVWIPVLRHLTVYFADEMWLLVFIVPAGAVAAMFVSRLVSSHVPLFYTFAKYAIVGFFSAGIDFAIFNLLIYSTGIESGLGIAAFKSVSFVFGLLNSYNWNKFWTFRFPESSGKSEHAGEFFRYVSVTVVGFIINVSLTSFVVNLIPPLFGMNQVLWDNAAVVAATVASMIWSFAGYKLIVFKSPADKNV